MPPRPTPPHESPEGIDAGTGHLPGSRPTPPAVAPPLVVRRSSPAGARTSPTGSTTRRAAAGCCAARRSARCSPPPTTWAASTSVISALAPTDVPVPADRSACAPTRPSTVRPSTSWTSWTGYVIRNAQEAAEVLDAEARASAPAARSPTCSPASTPSTSTPSASATSAARRGTSSASCERWYRQWEQSKTRELAERRRRPPGADRPHPRAGPGRDRPRRLPARQLPDRPTTGAIAAVLDWELCTLGDPLADLGLLLVYWTDPGDAESALPDSATAQPGFPNKAELVERYAAASGRDVSAVDYYVAFGYWKLACILEGVYARYRGGAMGYSEDASAYDVFALQVEFLAEAALAAVDRIPERGRPPRAHRAARPSTEPVLILALEGWIDAGTSAAVRRRGRWATGIDTITVARFSSEDLIDYRARRPIVHLVDGVQRGLTWPSIELRAATDADGNDVLLLVGAEPDRQWHRFTDEVVTLAGRLRRPPVRGPRRLPRAGAPHPAAGRGLHGLDAAAGRAGLPAGVARLPRRGAGGDRAALRRAAASPPRACGRRSPTTWSRRPAPCPTRPAAWPSSRRSAGSARLDAAGRRPADPGGRHPGPARRADRQQHRPPGDAAPARGGLRGGGGARARSSPPTCPPATSWRPSSSGSCGTSPATAEPRRLPRPALTRGSRRRGTVQAHEGRREHRRAEATAPHRRSSARPRATTACGPPRPATTRSSRCCSRSQATKQVELGTAIAVAFARNPMTLAQTSWDLQTASRGPLHPRPRQPDQGPHHPALLDAVVAPGPPHAGDDPGHPGHLGGVDRRHQARLPGRLLHPHPDDAVLRPRPQRLRPPQHLPGRRGRADDAGGRRGGRRLHLPRLHHRALPARGHAAGAGQGRDAAGKTMDGFELSARCSWSPARTRRRWRRPPRACGARSPSTARRPPTAACWSCTAGATCRTSSTACRRRAAGRRWATSSTTRCSRPSPSSRPSTRWPPSSRPGGATCWPAAASTASPTCPPEDWAGIVADLKRLTPAVGQPPDHWPPPPAGGGRHHRSGQTAHELELAGLVALLAQRALQLARAGLGQGARR